MKKLFLTSILVSILLLSSCATGPSTGTTGTATANVATGAVDVGVDQSFTVTFSAAVKTATVTASSFFVVPDLTANPSLIKYATFDSEICNADNAIEGTVTCDSSTECSFTPAEELTTETDYAICLTSDIQFEDTDTYGYFEGLTESFTTEANEEEEEEEEEGGTFYAVGGTVTGLSGTVVLQNNAADDLTVTANGSFTFDTDIASGETYTVTVETQPGSQTCTVTQGTGTISDDVTNVSVSCSNNSVYHDVTPSGTGVTITPDSAQEVAEGSSKSFTIAATGGKTVTDIIGGTCPAGSWDGNTYTTGSITADCTVTFAAYNYIYVYMSENKMLGNAVGDRDASTTICEDAYTARNLDALNCENHLALVGYTADNGVQDVPDNYDLPTNIPFAIPDDTEVASGWDNLIDNDPPLALYDGGGVPEIPDSSAWVGFFKGGGIGGACSEWEGAGAGTVAIFLNALNDSWSGLGGNCEILTYRILCMCW
ncbi:MAG: Ig-like domain-containing protein [bacterium]|nr:Ig-like domain-containing protein [bacterium]MBU1918573.1 Ig-like domain-containing protein [bacterium]